MSLRVLNCLHRSHPGGAHWRVAWVARELLRRGVETVVLLPATGGQEFETEVRATIGLRVVRTSLPAIRRDLVSNAVFVLTLPVVVARLVTLIRREQPDLVHVNGITNLQPVLAARLTRHPVLWHLNDMQTPAWYVRLMLPLMTHASVRLLVATEAIITHYDLDQVAGLNWARMPAPAPAQGSRDGATISKSSLGIAADARVIGFVGNLVPVKGCSDFLESVTQVMAREPNLHAVIVGPPVPRQEAYADALRRRVATSTESGRIHFVGFQRNVGSWLSIFDVFVFPSYSEACPIVVLEAMQHGIPVVATGVGDVPRMLRGLGAPVVEPGDVTALADGVTTMLALAPAERARLAADLRNRVSDDYSLDAITDLHERWYRSSAVEPRRRHPGR